jgi:hypothetical protein
VSVESNAILTEAELAAAMAEVEHLAAADTGRIPSLDEPPPTATVPVLVPVPNLRSGAAGTAPEPDKAIAASEPRAAATGAEPGKVSTPIPAAAAAFSEAPAGIVEQAPAEPLPPLALNRRSLGQLIYAVADTALDWINRPFGRLGDGGRAVVGLFAVVTLITSTLAMVVLPLFHEDRDPLGFLRRRPLPAAATGHDAGRAEARAAPGGH